MTSNWNRKRRWPRLVLTAMATLSAGRLAAADPSSDSASAGVFVEDPQTNVETQLEATLMADYGTQGVAASMLTAGLAKPRFVWSFDGPRAAQRLPTQPVFRFRFDPKSNTPPQDPAGMMAMMMGGGPPMPPGAKRAEDFVLLVLDVKADARELTTTSKAGVSKPKNAAVALVVEKVASNDFRIRTKQPLAVGEYGFFYSGPGGEGRIWAFGVD